MAFIQIDTSNILFIVGGAFVGLEKIVERRAGDPSVLIADATQARGIFHWNPKLSGLEENILYLVNNEYEAYGDELMNMGIVFDQPDRYYSYEAKSRDFTSKIFKIKKVEKR